MDFLGTFTVIYSSYYQRIPMLKSAKDCIACLEHAASQPKLVSNFVFRLYWITLNVIRKYYYTQFYLP